MAFNISNRSGSPILTDATFSNKHSEMVGSSDGPMTMSGFVGKLVLLVAVMTIASMLVLTVFADVVTHLWSIVSSIVGFVCVLALVFKPSVAKYVAIPYAISEGVFLSGLVVYVEAKFPGVALEALLATIALLFTTVICYRTGLISVNQKFLSIMKFAAVGILVYAIASIGTHIFAPSLFSGSLFDVTSGSWIGVGICALMLVFGAMSLVADLFITETGIQNREPKSFEWYCSMSVLISVVFIYVKMVELFIRLAYMNNDD